MMGFGMGIGWLFIVLLLVGGALLAFGFVKAASGGASSALLPVNRSQPPLEILKQRYAKGEINKEEYEQMKADLS